MFIISLTYIKPIEDVHAVLNEHFAYLDRYYAQNIFIVSGKKEPYVGGIILCHGTDLEKIKTIAKEDPFFIKGVATYEIIQFEANKCAENFASFLS